MAGIRLEWAQFGDFDSFDLLRSSNPMDINALPSPIATGLPTMFYVDTSVVEGATYYYRVVAWRDGVSKVSGEIKTTATSAAYLFNLAVIGGVFKDSEGSLIVQGAQNIIDGALNEQVTSPSNALWDWYNRVGYLEFEVKGSGNIARDWGSDVRFQLWIAAERCYLQFYTSSPFGSNQISFPVPGMSTGFKAVRIVRMPSGFFAAFVDEIEQEIDGNAAFSFNVYPPANNVPVGNSSLYMRYLRFVEG